MTLLGIVVIAAIFFTVLWGIVLAQRFEETLRRWIPWKLKKQSPRPGATRFERCSECGNLFSDAMLLNGLCMNCYEKLGREQRQETFGGMGIADMEDLATAYSILGCHPSDSDAQIRRLYYKKAKQIHPDVMLGKHKSDDMVKRSTEEFQKLEHAYHKIVASRGGK